ncbi:carbonic anhydrase [Clostridium coskatii]|uniref:Carbonic anhydrase n=1 Tax=Clostridium coskatii TaxID=1705578 RepID=A0A168NHW5_9CLOT|nr:carbonic anhydrase [Clostridium coskatii]OAA86459.1 hypothetical protein WX73_02817 [Clostridium coskatii]OBR92091.1 hypothetical protein CLCOS_32020 [Clostridium coskatii]
MNSDFAVLLNCMDGRTQLPAINWIRDNFRVKYVDIISEPGIDKVICGEDENFINSLKYKMDISINSHGASMAFIVGHYDCAANKVDKITHIEQIKKSVCIIKKLYNNIEVIGLWINENFEVEKI